MSFVLSSRAFEFNEEIPAIYGCEGMDVSPPLMWSGAPDGTKCFALFCNDPDAPGGVWHHWALFDIPAERKDLEPGVEPSETVNGMRQGINDFTRYGYGGPCPPPGHGVHHYHFILLALEIDKLPIVDLACAEVEATARRYALAEAEYIGTYER